MLLKCCHCNVNSILQELGLAHTLSPAPGAGLAGGRPESPWLNEWMNGEPSRGGCALSNFDGDNLRSLERRGLGRAPPPCLSSKFHAGELERSPGGHLAHLFHPHLADEETEALSNQVSCPKSHGSSVAGQEPGIQHGALASCPGDRQRLVEPHRVGRPQRPPSGSGLCRISVLLHNGRQVVTLSLRPLCTRQTNSNVIHNNKREYS